MSRGQLGIVAQEPWQWQQAEQYYQQALAITIEFGNRYVQAGTLHQLGRVVEEQRQWALARDWFVRSLEIYVEGHETDNTRLFYAVSLGSGLPRMTGASLERVNNSIEDH